MTRSLLQTDHYVFPAYDVPGTLEFYTGVLGFPLSGAFSGDDWGGRPWLMMLFDVGDGRQIVLCATAPSGKALTRDPDADGVVRQWLERRPKRRSRRRRGA